MNEFEQGVANMGGKYKGEGLTLLNIKEEDKEKKVVAVIVSFVSQASYDQLFTSVEQKSDEGSKVLVYSCDSSYLKEIQLAFEG